MKANERKQKDRQKESRDEKVQPRPARLPHDSRHDNRNNRVIMLCDVKEREKRGEKRPFACGLHAKDVKVQYLSRSLFKGSPPISDHLLFRVSPSPRVTWRMALRGWAMAACWSIPRHEQQDASSRCHAQSLVDAADFSYFPDPVVGPITCLCNVVLIASSEASFGLRET